MYRAGVESILGIRREGGFLVVNPCIPAAWPGFEVTVKVASTHYDIRVENSSGSGRNVVQAVLDGAPVGRTEGAVHVPLDGKKHVLAIHLLGADSPDLKISPD
jgi:cyclic beta-1,2-glucan synthetase